MTILNYFRSKYFFEMLRLHKIAIILLIALFSGSVRGQINTDRVMDIGRNALYFEDYILSIQYFNKVIRVKPYLAEPYFYRAIAKYSLDDFKGAQADCDKVLEINPFMINVYNLKGILYEKEDSANLAIKAYSEGLKLESNNLNLLFNRGISYINIKDYENAINDYTEILKYDPKNSSALGNRGMARLSAGDTLGCIADLDKMVAINSYSPNSYTTRGMLYYKQAKYELALADFDKAIELTPVENSGLYLNRAVIRYQLDDLRGTMADFDKVVEMDPRNSLAYTNRGILRVQVGDLNRAVEDFSRVLALDPTDMMTLMYRAELYLQLGEYQNALVDYNIVAQEYPYYGPLYASRSKVKQMLNDTKGAQRDYNTAVKLEHDRIARETKTDKQAAADKETAKENKATRKQSDKNIKNYRNLAVLDDFGDEDKEQVLIETIRGKVQNKDIAINLEPVFGLSFFTADSATYHRTHFNVAVNEFNKKNLFRSPLLFTNRELEEESSVSQKRYGDITAVSARLGEWPNDLNLLFLRGVLYSSVLNFNSSIADFDQMIKLDPFNSLAYFNRAYARFKMVEVIKSLDLSKSSVNEGRLTGNQPMPNEVKEDVQIIDYDLVIEDLNRVIAIDGSMEFAYFNRGLIRNMKRDFDGALSDFSKAIEINPYFAEAYYNRGLTLIYLRQPDQGTFDLSKAGELGLFKAYNVIKRYSGKQPSNDNDK